MIISHFCFALDLSKGGVPSGMINISKNLTENGIKNLIISTGNTSKQLAENSNYIEDLKLNGIGFEFTKSRFRNEYGLGSLIGLKRKLKEIPIPDLVVLHQVYSISTIIGYLYAKKFGIPFAVQPHGSLTKYHESDSKFIKSFAKKLIFSKILQDSNAIIVTCINEKTDLAPSLQIKSCILPYGAVNFDKNIQNMLPVREANENLRIIFSGRFDKKKNIPLLIESLPLVLKKYPTLTLEIAGSGTRRDLNEITQLISYLKIESSVNLHGWVNSENLRRLMFSSNLLVLPSENENFALVVSEALSLGIPCVVSKYVGTSDIVSRNKAGIVIDQLTSNAIAEGIIKVLDGDRATYKKSALEAVHNDLNWAKIAKNWRTLIESLA